MDSVGIALQCCIGGISSGFKVVQLSSRSFRFSVANNKVGHFIYGLKDRIWPDFVCHFHLFNGRFSRFSNDHHWHADEELSDLSSRRTMAIKSNLGFLHKHDTLDNSSDHELSKFHITPINHMHFSNANSDEASTSSMLLNNTRMNNRMMAPQKVRISLHNLGAHSGATDTANQQLLPAITTAHSLPEYYLHQKKLQESQLANYLILGGFKCLVDIPYPSPLQCFLSSAFKYAPTHS